MDGAKSFQEAYQGTPSVLLLPIYHMAFGGNLGGKVVTVRPHVIEKDKSLNTF